MPLGNRIAAALTLGVAFAASMIALADSGKPPARAPSAGLRKVLPLAIVRGRAHRVEGFDPLVHEARDGKLVSPLPDGKLAELTLQPSLQAYVKSVLESRSVPFGSLVAIEPASGRVLAYVSHSSAEPDIEQDLARDPTPPAASVFKVVTAAALIDAGVDASAPVCYGGGFHRLTAADLADDPQRDHRCATLGDALGSSINTIFAKLADRHLDAQTLERYAQAFGFGHALPFEAPTRASQLEVPGERLERARTAAGFWHMHMSPLHAALIAATIANDGGMPMPAMIERIIDANGKTVRAHEPKVFRQVISRATADAVAKMMQRTIDGTGRRAFHDRRGRAYLPDVAIAGKTGTLSKERPYRGYTWWVGFAPVDKPEIALASLVVNEPRWHIKAADLAREALQYWFEHARDAKVANEATPSTKVAASGDAEQPEVSPDVPDPAVAMPSQAADAL